MSGDVRALVLEAALLVGWVVCAVVVFRRKVSSRPSSSLIPPVQTNEATQIVTPCAKCGGDDIYVRWHRGGFMFPDSAGRRCNYGDFSKPSGEHLHHYCRGCGYDWFEDVVA